MQTLKLAEDIYNQLSTGKRVTIRKGRRDIALGDCLLECIETNRKIVVNVVNIHYCQLANVYIGDLQNDGFKDHFEMWETMKRFYPEITFDDEVTTIKFTIKAETPHY
jgi:hypothetical protein